MNLAIVQPVPAGRRRRHPWRDEIVTLGATLRQAHHTVALTLFDSLDESRLVSMVAEQRPDLILMYVESLAANLAFRVAGALASLWGSPVVAFGPHAARCPDEALSLAGAEAVAVSPADQVIPPYLDARREGPASTRTAGLWIKCETGIMRNPAARPPESITDQPLPARDLYNGEEVLDEAGFASVQVARGGEPADEPGKVESHAAASWPVLHRSTKSVLTEMIQVAEEQWDVGGFRLGNERWVSDPAFLAAFANEYARRIALPLRTRLYVPDVTDETASLLARAGCEEVCLPVGSATTLIRHDVLGMDFPVETVKAAFAALRRAGVRSAARVEIGAPYETAVNLEHSVDYLRHLDPDRVEAVLHWPAPGSHAEKVAKENGWLVPDPAAAYLAGQPAVVPPSLSADQIVTACLTIPYAVHRPRLVPLIQATRRIKIGTWTLYDVLVKPLLAPPMRRPK